MKNISRLDSRRGRTVLLVRGFVAGLAILSAGALELNLFKGFVVNFSLGYFGIHVILHYLALQLEGRRVRRIARTQGTKPLNVAKVLQSVERRKR